MALAAAIYLSLLGRSGLQQVSDLNYQKAHYAADQIARLPGYELAFDAEFFNEFVVRCPILAKEVNQQLLKDDILGGFDLGQTYKELSDCLLIAVTEMNTREEIDSLVEALREVSNDA